MKVTAEIFNPITSTKKFKSGDVGVIVSGSWEGKHILRTYEGFVLLEDPELTWQKTADFPVQQLSKGTKIILEVE